MKSSRAIFFLIISLPLLSCTQQSYDCLRAGTPQLEEYAGVYRLYPAMEYDRGDVPAGYEPVHICHYGRHGSRYILFDSQYVHVMRVLSKAHQDGKLTRLGEDTYSGYASVYPFLEGREGELSQVGRAQHKLIAKRMHEEYPEIFGKDPRITAVSTMTTRTIMSMGAFCESLKEEDPSLDIFQEASVRNIWYLNPYSSSSPNVTPEDLVYKSINAPWRPAFHEYIDSLVDTEPFLDRLFADKVYAEGLCHPMDFMRDLYSVAVHMHGTEQAEVSFMGVFTDEELALLWECDNITFYIEKGLDFVDSPRGPELAGYMLREMISTADAALQQERPSVALRFGHDGCLMGLYTMMGLEGWNVKAKDFSYVKNVFQSWRIPMAANMQLVLWNSASAEPLVSLYLNESICPLPLEPVGTCFYKWSDFKSKYEK